MKIDGLIAKVLSKGTKHRIKRYIARKFNIKQLNATYDRWIVENFPDASDLLLQKQKIETFSYKPLITITLPTYNTLEEHLKECIDSVLSQSYEHWELVIVDDASTNSRVRDIIMEYALKETRIKHKFLPVNLHIAGATNQAIKIATGEFVGLFDHDDLLWPNALYEVAAALNKDKNIDFLYSDQDKIVEQKHYHAEPFFKPDWSPSLLRTCNYITHFSVYRRELIKKVGYERGEYNGAQDWDLLMRATREARKIHHIPKVLYSWRVHDNSTAKTMDSKPYVTEAQKSTIASDLMARGYNQDDFVINQDNKFSAFWRTTYRNIGNPKVSIIVLDKKQAHSFPKVTTYRNQEIIVARNYNNGIKQSTGEYVVLVEPGIRIRSKNWVNVLLDNTIQSRVGLAGGLTLYANEKYIFSAGVYVDKDDKLAFVLSSGLDLGALNTMTRIIYAKARRDTSALTGCVMVKKSNLEGFSFDDRQETTHQLVTLSAELIEKGFYNVYDPAFVNTIHIKYKPNKKHKRTYGDRPITMLLDKKHYHKFFSQRYFYDDLVSYPDSD